MPVRYVHLKLHSEYSLMDSIIRIKPLLQECNKRNLAAVAITDICNMFGALKFYKSSISSGIKPIFGTEIWVKVDDKNYSLTFIAKNNLGYQVIVELLSYIYHNSERMNGIPVISKDILKLFDFTNIFVLSGGMHGDIAQACLLQKYDRAEQILFNYLKIFPKENFFIELQRLGYANEESYIKRAIHLAKKSGIPVVATNDVRFLDEDDYLHHEIRVGIYQGYTLLNQTRKSQYTKKQYLRSANEMCKIFSDIPESLSNSVYIAQNSNVFFNLGKTVLPNFDVPSGISEPEYFANASIKGLEERFEFILVNKNDIDKPIITKNYMKRLKWEIDIICQMGFSGYFLIVADFIQWSKDHGIPVGPGRGSGAGSLVAYALKITNIDPIPYGLLFERFLNPERVSLPDFDIDFSVDGRDRVINYVSKKYGTESVSQIITYGSMSAKAVVRDVGRVLGHPYGFVDKIAKLIPHDLGIKLKEASALDTPLYDFCQQDENAGEIIKISLKLEGLTRSIGKHAAGVVISPSKVTDFSPVYCEAGTKQLITQFDKKDVEEVGLVKFDFLGLRNLTIIDKTLKIINKRRCSQNISELDIMFISMQDRKTFDLLKNAETTGVFQLESRGMKELIKRLQPDCFQDIIALVALYRPGPLGSGMVDDFINRKHGKQKVTYLHPDLKEVLEETYGIILYQEQVMKIAQILASYSLGGADLFRRAMGKKIPEEMSKQRVIFEEGAAKNGINRKLASSIFNLMEEFAKYGFNKSHSAAYALISYQTAYLKAHYPEDFMAALLSSDMENTDKVVNFISESKKMNLKLIFPHVNVSDYYFTVNQKTQLIYGLGAIKGVGFIAIEKILTERKQNGIFRDLYDFCSRLDTRRVNKRVCKALIYAGAMDGFAKNREILIATVNDAMRASEQKAQMQNSGQRDLFGSIENSPLLDITHDPSHFDIQNWSIKDKLIFEKSVLGISLSGHLIDQDKPWLKYFKVLPLSCITSSRRKESVLLAGVITFIVKRKTKLGKVMAILQIDDSHDRIEVVIFSDLYDSVKNVISIDNSVIVEGEVNVDTYNDYTRVNALLIEPLTQYVNNNIKSLSVDLSYRELSQLCSILKKTINLSTKSNVKPKTIKLYINFNRYSLTLAVKDLCIDFYLLYIHLKDLKQETTTLCWL